MTAEEIRQALANFWGIPISKVPPVDTEKMLQGIRNKRDKLNVIIAELKTKLIAIKAPADKFEELEEVGRFIVDKDETMKLVVPEVLPRHPDFLISHKNCRIGLEHTRLVSQDMKAVWKTVKYCLKKAQAILAEEHGYLSKTVNISVDYNKAIFDAISFSTGGSREPKKQMWISIADFVWSLLTGGEVKKPDFIYQFTITPNKDSRIDIEISERFITDSNIAPALLERIANKEEKAINYRNAIEVDLLGLLVVLDDLNSVSGFDLQEGKLPTITESQLDNIFLFEKQSGAIKTLYSNNSIL